MSCENTNKPSETATKESEEERQRKKEQEIEQWELMARMSKHIPIPEFKLFPTLQDRVLEEGFKPSRCR